MGSNGMFDKVLGAFRVNDYDDDYYDYDGDDNDEEFDGPKRESKKVTPIKKASRNRNSSAPGMDVVLYKPSGIREAKQIVETLLQNRIVNLNLEGLDVSEAQRIIDFISGATCAMDGQLQQISHYIFLVTPPGVGVMGDTDDDDKSGDDSSPVSRI
ncbi:MAG: cell division protein SepF [Lachnospiraceae bacterium]|nr:cell division protein SepF [Lachnospiraceae bacterium]